MWLDLCLVVMALAVQSDCLFASTGSKFGMFSRGRGGRRGGFAGFFSSLRKKVKVPMCNFYQGKLPMSSWPEKSEICMPEDKTLFPYPSSMVSQAMVADPHAELFLSYLTQCYQAMPQMAAYGSYPAYRYQDVCQVDTLLVDKVWKFNRFSNPKRQDVCYVVQPEQQNIQMAVCRTNCTMDTTNLANHFCVPDGFIVKTALVFCPWDFDHQCTPIQIKVPRGCSCKKFSCLKYA